MILASAAVGSGAIPEAIEYLSAAFDADMSEASALSNKSFVYELNGNHYLAFESIRNAIALSPSTPQLYNNLGVLFRNLKKFEDSRKAIRQCLASLPTYAPALNNLALLDITVSQLSDAEARLREASECDPTMACLSSNISKLQNLRSMEHARINSLRH